MAQPEVFEKFQFFPAQRRKIELLKWHPLMNAQSEKRICFTFLMPLTGQSLVGIPNFVAPGYENMEREDSKITESDIGIELEGVTVEGFSTDSAQFPIETPNLGRAVLTAATLRNFKVVRESRDKVLLVCLQFSVTVKRSLGLLEFADTYEGGTFWCSFTETQPTIPVKEEEESSQMKLEENQPITEETKEAVGTRTALEREGRACPFADDGKQCVLEVEHGGDHVMAAPVDLVHERQSKTRTRKEKEAVEAGKPRGFVQ